MALKLSVIMSYACSVLALLSASNGYNVKVTPSESVLLIDFKSSMAVSQNFSMYAGYNFVASIEANNELRVVAGAPRYANGSSQISGANGAIIECLVTQENLSGKPADSNQVNCSIAVDDSMLKIGDNQKRKTDGLGMTLIKQNGTNNHYLTCTHRRQKQCGSGNIYTPGACYSGELSNNITLMTGWNEIPCFLNYLDVMFVIDSSNSIEDSDFTIMKSVLMNVSNTFKDSIGDTTQIGILQYGNQYSRAVRAGTPDLNNPDYYTTPTELGDCDSITCFQNAIRTNMNHLKTGNTFTATAIKRAVKVDFAKSRNKEVSTKILVLITDGAATDAYELKNSYDLTTAENITVYAIGVGNNADTRQLALSATGNGSNYDRVLTSSQFSDLEVQLSNLTRAISSVSAEGGGAVDLTLENAQLGISGHYSQEGALYIGAVGANGWRGTIVKYDSIDDPTADVFDANQVNSTLLNKRADSYLGYAITSGFFNGGTVEYVAAGAPKHYSHGTVILHESKPANSSFQGAQTLRPFSCSDCSARYQSIGSYFGGALLSADFNNDGKDDLLVSAPLYSLTSYDEGKVFVYISQPSNTVEKWSNGTYHPLEINGSKRGGRFGTTMASAGDLNDDGFIDVAIAAPCAESNQGEVYIYHGANDGLNPDVKQIISASSFTGLRLQYFGLSLQGDIDVDGNLYPDLLVGAPMSDAIVLFRTRPVASLNGKVHFNSSALDSFECFANPNKECLKLRACFTVDGKSVEDSVDVIYNLTVDANLQRVELRQNANSSQSGYSLSMQRIKLIRGVEKCDAFRVYPKKQLVNTSVPISAVMTYGLPVIHGSSSLSSITAPDASNVASDMTMFTNYCGDDGICEYNLQVDAHVTLPPFSVNKNNGTVGDITDGGSILVIASDTANKPVIVKVNLTNAGEHAFSSRATIAYSSVLSFLKIEASSASNSQGSCVTDNQPGPRNETVNSRILSFGFSKYPSNVFPERNWCYFVYQLSHVNLRNTGNKKTISVSIMADSLSSGTDINPADNSVTKDIPVKYRADIQATKTSFETIIPYNFTAEDSTIYTVYEIGSKTSDVTISYEVQGLGYSNVPSSTLMLRYPSYLTSNHPLLYLYKLDCRSTEGNVGCTCDKSLVNKYNLSLVRNSRNESSIFDQINLNPIKSTVFDCSQTSQTSHLCENFTCVVENLGAQDKVEMTATFRLWTSSLQLSNQSEIGFRSEFSVSTINSPLILDDMGKNSTNHRYQSLTTAKIYVEEVTPEAVDQSWIYIAAGGGAFALLIVIMIILYKAGFFKNKYYDLQQELQWQEANATNVSEVPTINELSCKD
ncbi:integrin alpha-2-like [Clavelina lepadiformis]|uniref:integrin alpha-2-like n=1 Tax=Clavelina lepadiformis TaxID=159417 RepID=UPI004043066B